MAGPKNVDEPVSIFVDNSFSMDAVSTEGTLLDIAVRKAREIALSYPASTRFQLLTSDFQAVQQRLLSREDFMGELERVKLSPMSRSLSEVVLRQKEALMGTGVTNASSFIISDFQKSTFDPEQIKPDSSFRVSLVALPLQETNNLFIDSCWLSSPVVQINKPAELSVRLVNSSTRDVENVPVKLSINGSQKAVTSLSVPAGQSVNTTFSFTITGDGWQSVEVQLTDHPITFDDEYYFAFEVKQKLNVLVIHEKEYYPFMEALFGKDSLFNYRRSTAGEVDYAGFREQQLIVLDGLTDIASGLADELKKYLLSGGSICVFPDSLSNLNSYNNFFNSVGADAFTGVNENADKVTVVDLQHPLFADVFDRTKLKEGSQDYPSALKHFDVASNAQSKREILMKLEGGAPFLAAYNGDKGSLYVFSVPLNPGYSNLARHAIFVPTLYRMALLGAKPLAFANTLGKAQPVILNIAALSGDETFHLTNRKLNTDIIPLTKSVTAGLLIDAGEQVQSAGFFELMKGSTLGAVLAFNYDRKESEMKFMSEEEITNKSAAAHLSEWRVLKSSVPDLGKTLNAMNQGVPLWKYAILLTLIFLLVETLLIRFWKTT